MNFLSPASSSAETSKDALEEKAMRLASLPGYREFTMMPIIAKIIANSTKNSYSNSSVSDSPQTASKNSSKDPEIVSTPTQTKSLKINDSEADVLTKYYSLLEEKYKFNKQKNEETREFNKKVSKRKNKEYEQTIFELTGVKPGISRVRRKEIEGKGGALGKYGLLGAAGLGLFMLSSNVQAAIKNFDLSSAFPDFSKINDIISRTEPREEPSFQKIPTLFTGTPREMAEKYLGRAMTDQEWDYLLRATNAEAGFKSQEEVTYIMAAILNRARTRFGGAEGSVIKVLEEKNQFQAVTGTKFQPGPTKGFQLPVSMMKPSRISQLTTAASSLFDVPTNLYDFTAARAEAYGPGTNIGYRNRMLEEGGIVIGETVFRKPPQPIFANLPVATTQVVNSQTYGETLQEKINQAGLTILNNTTNVVNGSTNYIIRPNNENVKDKPAVSEVMY